MERRSRRGKKKILILCLMILIVVLGAFVVWKVFFTEQESEWDDSLSQSDLGQITYEGRKYIYNSNLTNILFLGIDNEEGLKDDNMPSEAGQSDCIMVLTLDKEKKEARILQIPRDTMTEVDLYDASGNYSTMVTEQIATQYAYSIGGKSSCFATKKTVSELLYDLPIDGYLAMEYSSIAIVNDAVGGVEITVPEDYTMIDPAFEKGATLKLTGKQAHAYVRWRDTNASFSNYDRMDRQVQYIPALIDTIQNQVGEDGNYYKTLYPLVEKHMITDLSEDEINALAEYELITSDVQYLPGEGKKGKEYEEFYVDEKKLQKMLIETFYILEE